MRISFVVAVAENGVIGRSGALPWRLPSELGRFKRLTMGKPLIMGRKTFCSIGRALPGRDNIVVTRRRDFAAEGVIVAGDIEEALAVAERCAQARGTDEVMVIGGAEIYRALLPRADRIYKTVVHAAPDGDTRFPEIDAGSWRESAREFHEAQAGDSADYTIVVLERAD